MTSKTLSAVEGEGLRLDKFLSNQLPELSRTKIQKMINDGLVFVNNTEAKASLILDGSEFIAYTVTDLNINIKDISPQEIPLEILYEDNFIIAINKQPGLIVHPGNGHPSGTLANGLVYYFDQLSDLNGSLRPGIVHRLDKDTSGVILIAKDNQLVFEAYFPGRPIYGVSKEWNKNDLHNQHSVTKSFNSALIGIAIDKHGLALDDPIKDFFPEIEATNWTDEKENITVEDLLIMSSGLEWDEWSFSYDDE
ncbi:MAG: serine hydrolase, partial [Candidatus Marinimicrobia bacterium]|nr:serine hydrolase [Candidatus Neomarinimicrobiota bacterium]